MKTGVSVIKKMEKRRKRERGDGGGQGVLMGLGELGPTS